MTRKDTILIAVVINAALLAILFVTAIIYDTDTVLDQAEINTPIVKNQESIPQETQPSLATNGGSAIDEVDNVLNYYNNTPSQTSVVETTPNANYVPFEMAQSNTIEEATPVKQNSFVEITVKKGDVLEKIAKTNGTTVSAIKKANQLKDEKLKIGQVLKIPLKKDESQNGSSKISSTPSDQVFHTVKSGDSPWKIAKQYSVNYEDILKLNGMDEEKARNLKIGDKIRVK